jgi:protein gp37
MNPNWARALRDQCLEHSVPFHFKQWGNWRPMAAQMNSHRVREVSNGHAAPIPMVNVGKRAAGRDLDGKQWDGVPCIA